MTLRPTALTLAAAITALLSGCGQGPALHYRVDFAHRDSSGVPVTLDIDEAPRDSLVLEGYTAAALMPVSRIEVTTASGPAPRARLMLRTLRDGHGGLADFPVVRIEGPLPSHLTLRYHVALGEREGNGHTGYTGRAAGHLDEQYAFAGGRSLFMVPSPAGRIRGIDVRFDLPPGWTAATPWPREGDTWQVGVRGAPVAEALLWSALGFGRFDETRLERFGTTFRFEVERGIPALERDAALTAYQTIVRRVTAAFGRGLGSEYVVVIAPPAENGDELIPEGWATGTGGTLAPLTTARARNVAAGLVDAYLAQQPYRTTVRDAKEKWIVEGVSHLLPWRALEAAGLSRREDLERWLASDYAHEMEGNDAADVEWNLEHLDASDFDTRLGREVLAPLALMRVDDTIRAMSGGRDSLDGVLRQVFGGSSARPFWGSLTQAHDARWTTLRDIYVRGNGSRLKDDALFTLKPPRETPEPARGAITRRLTLAITGNTFGFLENCGCKVNQAGGVARRATILHRLRQQAPTLALDAGNALIRAENFTPPDFLAREEEKTYLRMMTQMGYPLAAAGPAELGYGLKRFRETTAAGGPQFLLANARDAAGPLLPGWRVVEAGGVRVGVVGLMEPGRGPYASEVMERYLGTSVTFVDPLAALRRLLPAVRAQSDIVIAMGLLSPPTVRRIAAAFPELDVVVSTDDDAASRLDDEGRPDIASSDAQGFLGQTLVLYATQSSFGLNGATLGLDAQKHVASAELFATWLGDSVPDDRAIRDELARFYDRIGSTQAAQASVPPLFPKDAERLSGAYVGAARCMPCHAAEHIQWKDTNHASAFKTLLDAHRNYQPRCVVCHVVGYGTPTGYRLGSADAKLVGVQCEVCHGPGAAHVTTPLKANIRREVPAAVCLECHNAEHSDHFVYADRLPRVMHDQRRVIEAGGR